MFHVDPDTKRITLHRGDTGTVTFKATGRTYGSNDRALFAVRSRNNTIIMKTYYSMTDNEFTVEFNNPLTDYLTPGTYYYDVRYIVNPVWQGSGADAQIVDGEVVSTPGSPYEIVLLDTVGQI